MGGGELRGVPEPAVLWIELPGKFVEPCVKEQAIRIPGSGNRYHLREHGNLTCRPADFVLPVVPEDSDLLKDPVSPGIPWPDFFGNTCRKRMAVFPES